MRPNHESKPTSANAALKRAEQLVAEQSLRQSNARLQRQLREAKAQTGDLVAAVRQAITDSVAGIDIPPVPRPTTRDRRRNRDEEKAIVCLGDVQHGKRTKTYNSQVSAERIHRYANKVLHLTDIMRSDHPVREARVYLLGDMVEGEIIFPHQPFQIDSSLFVQIKDMAEINVKFLRTLLTGFDKLHVVGIIGNHGRLSETKRYNPESNADRMMYHLLQSLLREEPRITWNIPWEQNEAAWYAVDYPFAGTAHPGILQHGVLLFHGDQIPGSAAHSVGTVAKHLYGWASGAVNEPFSYAIYGHHHTPRRFRFNKFTAWCNGSVESTNTFAQEKLAAVGYPEQLLMYMHPRRGITAEYWCRLEED